MKNSANVRKITVTAVLAAVATVLMFISFNIPVMPSFIKLDLSELPALIASLTLGPVSGIAVCFVKNLVNLLFSTTGGVGELSNFILGSAFVLPAGILFKKYKSRKSVLIGSTLGAALMAVIGLFSNFFIIYPIYTAFLPMEAIMGMYQALNPNVETLWQALITFNLPFTFFKGMISTIIAFLIYKKLLPIINGKAI